MNNVTRVQSDVTPYGDAQKKKKKKLSPAQQREISDTFFDIKACFLKARLLK